MNDHEHEAVREVAREAAREPAREEARAIGKRTVWAVLAAFLIFGAAVFVSALVVAGINRQACADRIEARDAIRDTLADLALARPDPVTGELVELDPATYTEGQRRVAERIAPGGPLAPIVC